MYDRIEELFTSVGLKQKAFCKITGIPQSTLSMAKKTGTDFSRKTLDKIAKAFPDWDMKYIITGERSLPPEINDNGSYVILSKSLYEEMEREFLKIKLDLNQLYDKFEQLKVK